MILLHIARASVFPNAWYTRLEAEEMFFHNPYRSLANAQTSAEN
jgi:hypothetical protein